MNRYLKKSIKLEHALITGFIFMAIIPILIVGIIAHHTLVNNFGKEINNNNQLLAKSISSEIESFLNEPLNLLMNVKEAISDKKIIKKQDTDSYLKSVVNNYNYFESIRIIDNQGKITNIAPYTEAFIGLDMSEMNFYKITNKFKKLYWSKTFISLQTGKPTITLSIPLENGVLVGYLNLEKLSNIINKFEIGKDSYIAILDNSGTYIAHSDMTKVKQRQVDNNYEKFVSKRGDAGTYNLKYQDNKKLVSVAKVNNTDWPVVIYQDYNSAFLPVTKVKKIFRFGMLISLVIATWFACFNVSRIMGSIKEFINKTKAISEGNYSISLRHNSYYEFYELAEHFRNMAKKVHAREVDLVNSNEKLEETNGELMATNEELLATEEELRQQMEEVNKNKEKLLYVSMHDAVTGLYNRTCFEEEMTRMKNEGYDKAAVIMLDLDGLKLVNDTMGHKAGDYLLIALANILKICIDDKGMVARIGGDEFAIIIPNGTEEQVAKINQNINQKIEKFNYENPEYHLSISIGYATSDNASLNMDKLLEEADNNMYRVKLHRSQSTHSSIVQTLTKALEARDFITEGHGERLVEIIEKVGEKIGFSASRIYDMKLLGQFHDIGKVGIPDKILFKPGPLTKDERVEMERHCGIGYRIAQSSPDLTPIAEMILKHHECWNGKGYPLGLEGEEIPIECRILAIADAYDAMTNDRPYRNALSHSDAVEELYKNSGGQFDPYLVPIVLEVIEAEYKVNERTIG